MSPFALIIGTLLPFVLALFSRIFASNQNFKQSGNVKLVRTRNFSTNGFCYRWNLRNFYKSFGISQIIKIPLCELLSFMRELVAKNFRPIRSAKLFFSYWLHVYFFTSCEGCIIFSSDVILVDVLSFRSKKKSRIFMLSLSLVTSSLSLGRKCKSHVGPSAFVKMPLKSLWRSKKGT